MDCDYQPIRIPDKGERTICSSHFADSVLCEFIEHHGESGECSFCGHNGKVMDFADFIEHARKTVYRYFGTIDDENLPAAFFHGDNWGFGFVREPASGIEEVMPTEGIHSLPTSELLYEMDLLTGEEKLDAAIEECFDMGQEWIRHDPLSFSNGEWVSYYWDSFRRTIMSGRRFTIDEYLFEGDHYGETLTYAEVISRIFSTIRSAGLITTLREGTRIFRSRSFPEGVSPSGFDDLTAPPSKYAKQNRMSPAGISMFYGALSPDTTIAELGNVDGVIFTGRFTIVKDLNLLDLTSLPRLSYWRKVDMSELAFLHKFAVELSRPISHDYRIDVEYLPTQAFTEYVRYRFKNSDGLPVDGIIYNSSKDTGGRNVVLFCDHNTSREWLELSDYKDYGR